MDRWKSTAKKKLGQGESSEKIRGEEDQKGRKSEERRCRCAKREERRETPCFSMLCGSGGPKSRLAKAVGAEPAGQMRDEKLHAIVARSTFASQECQRSKHTILRPLLEVEMSKRCTPLWHEAHLQVKSVKRSSSRTTFGS